jgi:hypothetical protein
VDVLGVNQVEEGLSNELVARIVPLFSQPNKIFIQIYARRKEQWRRTMRDNEGAALKY